MHVPILVVIATTVFDKSFNILYELETYISNHWLNELNILF